MTDFQFNNKNNRSSGWKSRSESAPRPRIGRILTETTKGRNDYPARQSFMAESVKKSASKSVRPGKSMTNFDDSLDGYESNHSASGILSKLKSDINSLELLRQHSEYADGDGFPARSYRNTHGDVGAFADDESKSTLDTLGSNGTGNSSFLARAKSVDRFFRETDSGELMGSRVVGSVLQTKKSTATKKAFVATVSKIDHAQRKSLEEQLQLRDEENVKLQKTILSLKEECIKEKEDNARHLSSIEDMKRKVDDAKSKEGQLKQSLRDLITNIDQERKLRAEEFEVVSELQLAEVKSLKEQLTEKIETIGGLEKVAQINDEEFQMLQDKVEKLEMKLEDHASQSNKQTKQLEELANNTKTKENEWTIRLKTLEQQLACAKREGEISKTAYAETQHENEQLRSSIEESKTESTRDVERLKKSLDEANEARDKATKQLDSLKTLENERQALVSKMEQRVKTMEDEKNDSTSQIASLQKQLSDIKSESSGTIAALKKSLDKSKEATADAKSQLNDVLGKLKESTSTVENFGKKVQELENQNSKLRKAVSSAESDFATRVGEKDMRINDMNKIIQRLQDKMDGMKLEIHSYKVQLSKIPEYEAKVKELKGSLKEWVAKSNIMEKEVSSLQQELSNMNNRLAAAEKKYTALKKERKSLSADASEAKELEQGLRDTIKQLVADKETATANIDAMTSELTKAAAESAAKNEQLRSALESLDEMMKYIDTMREENDDITRELEVEVENAHKR